MRLIDADELKKHTYPFPCAIGVENAVTLRAVTDAPTVNSAQHEFIEDEVIENCTVRVLRCKVCGEYSIGWRKNNKGDR